MQSEFSFGMCHNAIGYRPTQHLKEIPQNNKEWTSMVTSNWKFWMDMIFSFWHFQMKIIFNAKKIIKIVDRLEPQLTREKYVWN
jgi:hypothetical protein